MESETPPSFPTSKVIVIEDVASCSIDICVTIFLTLLLGIVVILAMKKLRPNLYKIFFGYCIIHNIESLPMTDAQSFEETMRTCNDCSWYFLLGLPIVIFICMTYDYIIWRTKGKAMYTPSYIEYKIGVFKYAYLDDEQFYKYVNEEYPDMSFPFFKGITGAMMRGEKKFGKYNMEKFTCAYIMNKQAEEIYEEKAQYYINGVRAFHAYYRYDWKCALFRYIELYFTERFGITTMRKWGFRYDATGKDEDIPKYYKTRKLVCGKNEFGPTGGFNINFGEPDEEAWINVADKKATIVQRLYVEPEITRIPEEIKEKVTQLAANQQVEEEEEALNYIRNTNKRARSLVNFRRDHSVNRSGGKLRYFYGQAEQKKDKNYMMKKVGTNLPKFKPMEFNASDDEGPRRSRSRDRSNRRKK